MTSKTIGEPLSFESFLESGTVGCATVDIQMDLAALGEAEALLARIDRLESRGSGDETLAAVNPASDLEDRLEALYDRIDAGKSTWTLLALTPDVVESIVAEYPAEAAPKMPPPVPPLAEGATDAARAAHKRAETKRKKDLRVWGEAVKEWKARDAENTLKRQFAFIAASVHSIDSARGPVAKPTAAAIERMYRAPHGQARYEKLIGALNAANRDDVEISRPTLPAS